MAASDADGEVFFSTLGYESNIGARFTAKEETTLIERSLAGTAKPSRLQARAMDNLLRDERVDLVKVDVEGYEPAVFRGLHEVLCQQRPMVFSEFAPGTIRHISKSDPAEMLRFVRDCGYTISVVENTGVVTGMGGDIAKVLARHDARQHHLDLMFTPLERVSQSS